MRLAVLELHHPFDPLKEYEGGKQTGSITLRSVFKILPLYNANYRTFARVGVCGDHSIEKLTQRMGEQQAQAVHPSLH